MRRSPLALAVIAGVVVGGFALPARAASVPGLSGTAFEDDNRNTVQDAGEAPLTNQQLYVFDANGSYVTQAATDSTGHYSVAGLAAGTYTVAYSSTSADALQHDWVPTTTGSLQPSRTVAVTGPTTVDFGWRRIVRSTVSAGPISTYTGPNGLVVESYDDAVPARAVFDAIMRGTVGNEASHVIVRFDADNNAVTTISVSGTDGSYSAYKAVCYDTWDSWLLDDASVSHEYGHAWSNYYATMVQQDGAMSAYLKARGIYGDARLNSTYLWQTGELIAEDYRQLLGSPTAQARVQANRDLPPAASVPGLRDFLLTTFTTPPSGGTATGSSSGTTSTTGPRVSVPTVNPTPVSKSGTISSSVSVAASVTVQVRDSSGAVVRTLLAGVSRPAGSLSATWDRKDAAGARVKAGTYTAVVQASANGTTGSASAAFSVQ